MTDTADIIDVGEIVEKRKGRRGDGGVYLVVADETPEFAIALRYAARMAQSNRGHVGIIQIMNIDDFQHWGSVEEMMRKEMRDQGEKFIWTFAKTVNELNGMTPVLYIAEGNRNDALVDVINEDTTIRLLVLGGGTGGSGPGALVQHFTGKGLGRLRVPVMVVPGNLTVETVDAITGTEG
jgi:hypothetical protein